MTPTVLLNFANAEKGKKLGQQMPSTQGSSRQRWTNCISEGMIFFFFSRFGSFSKGIEANVSLQTMSAGQYPPNHF